MSKRKSPPGSAVKPERFSELFRIGRERGDAARAAFPPSPARDLLARVNEQVEPEVMKSRGTLRVSGLRSMIGTESRQLWMVLADGGRRAAAAEFRRAYRKLVTAFQGVKRLDDEADTGCDADTLEVAIKRTSRRLNVLLPALAAFKRTLRDVIKAADNRAVGDAEQAADDHWTSGERLIKMKYVSNLARLSKLRARHKEICRDATSADRQRLGNERLRYVWNARAIYELTEGIAGN